MKEKKARVEDALHATRAAVEEGIVPGGGVALIRAQKRAQGVSSSTTRDEQIGVDIVRRAIEEPIRMIAQNAGVEGSIVVEKVGSSQGRQLRLQRAHRHVRGPGAGGRHRSDEGDAHGAAERGVDRGLLLTTEAIIVEKKEEKPATGAGGAGRRHGRDVLTSERRARERGAPREGLRGRWLMRTALFLLSAEVGRAPPAVSPPHRAVAPTRRSAHR